MGFGKGVGFTPKPTAEQTSYLIKYGGGAARVTLAETTPTHTEKYGGGAARVTLAESNPTYETSVA